MYRSMKMFKDSWFVFVAIIIFIILAYQNFNKANATRPTQTTYPAVMAPVAWDMLKKECKMKAKNGDKLPKHCHKFV